jgi:urea transport system ATP-binding protein
VVEQKIDFARQLAQKFFIMEKGAIVANGETAHLTDALVHQYLTV